MKALKDNLLIKFKNVWVLTAFSIAVLYFILIFQGNWMAVDADAYCEWVENAFTYGLKAGFAVNEETYPPLSTLFMTITAALMQGHDVYDAVYVTVFVFLMLSIAVFACLFDNKEVLLIFTMSMLLCCRLCYIDIFMAPFLLLAVHFLLNERYVPFALCFSVCAFVKFQPLILVPILATCLVSRGDRGIEIDWKSISKVVVTVLAVCAVVAAVYGIYGVFSELFAVLKNDEALLSGNALNFPWVVQYLVERFQIGGIGFLNEDGMITIIDDAPRNLLRIGYVFWLVYLSIFLPLFLLRKKTIYTVLQSAVLAYTAYFIFNTAVHENHLFISVLLMMILCAVDNTAENRLLAIILSLAFNANLWIFYGTNEAIDRIRFGTDSTVFIALLNTALFCLFWIRDLISKIKTIKENKKGN